MLKFDTLDSGNTFGAVYWTDGKREAPMLPETLWLMKSPAEGVLFWQDECKEVGRVPFGDDSEPPEWRELEFGAEPSERDYGRALDTGMGSTAEKHRYLRTRRWWAANDLLRQGLAEATEAFHDEGFVNNLRALAELLDDRKLAGRLMHAEVLRELGEFDAALALLPAKPPAGFAMAVERIRKLAAARDRFVQRLTVG